MFLFFFCSTQALKSNEKKYQTTIWGPTCDCLDILSDSHRLPNLNIGDWLLLDNIGAYSVSLSSKFNGFEIPQIFFVVTAETLGTTQTVLTPTLSINDLVKILL